jgi:hypothetical protein
MIRRKPFLASTLSLAAAFVFHAQAQVACTYVTPTPPVIRSQGFTEPVADIVLQCTGGVSTPMNDIVPQVNVALTINTNLTSRITEDAPTIDFSEALLLIDEPNSPAPAGATFPSTPLLNCGHNGAPDNGAIGPGVCETVSDGNPLQSYSGQINVMGTTPCDGMGTDPTPNTFGCGRPNAFAGRMQPASTGGVLENQVEFMGVPFDPPGASGTLTLRITNIRANAVALNSSTPVAVSAVVTITSDFAIGIPAGDIQVATLSDGMTASIPAAGTVRITEGFSTAFRDRNISFTLANATFTGSGYQYSGGLNYPAEAAQNIPGVVYTGAEDLFEWQNNAANAPPSPNPPAGFGSGTVTNLDYPLDSSMMFGGVNTNINTDGVTTQGTRVALHFIAFPGVSVTVPPIVYLHTSAAPTVNSGVMVLTGTDLNGAGPYTPFSVAAPATVQNGLAVYEVLYADPNAVEFADVPVTTSGFLHEFTVVSASFAPFYLTALTPGAGQATPTAAHATPTATPRFNLTGSLMFLYQ